MMQLRLTVLKFEIRKWNVNFLKFHFHFSTRYIKTLF